MYSLDDFKAWASEHAIRFEPLDGATADVEKLAVLDAALESKRIVYLGESDHYVHELYEFRLLLTRYLFARGWRWIGEELGVSDGARIDQYYATGNESHLDRISAFGYRGAFRTDRDDTPTGILKEAWGPAFPVYMKSGTITSCFHESSVYAKFSCIVRCFCSDVVGCVATYPAIWRLEIGREERAREERTKQTAESK
jgi:hypothetical protein